MCQKVKNKQINYNWLYIIVHIIMKHNHEKNCNCGTLEQKVSALDFPYREWGSSRVITLSLSFCVTQMPAFIKAESPKE